VRAALGALAIVALWAGIARADAGEDAFRAASEKLGAGDLEGAQQAFEAIAAADPQGAWADDALAEAAQAAERRGRLDDAHRLWRRVLDQYPSSRAARRARARVAALEQAIGEGGRWLAVAEEHDAILRATAGNGPLDDAIARMEALVAANPEYPRAEDARMWIGDTWMRMARPDRAIEAYRAAGAAAKTPEDTWRAGKALGDALALDGQLDAAEAQYRTLYGTSDALGERAIDESLRDLEKVRSRQRLTLAAWIALVLAMLLFAVTAWRATSSVGAAARALVRPPVEILYFIPVALVLAGASLTGNLMVWHAVRSILLGGFVITWVSGASLEAARRRGRLGPAVLIVHLVATVLAVAAICWLSILSDRLIDMIKETWAHGHDYNR
jgi:tetratricopeptide (TPR) repeat protein